MFPESVFTSDYSPFRMLSPNVECSLTIRADILPGEFAIRGVFPLMFVLCTVRPHFSSDVRLLSRRGEVGREDDQGDLPADAGAEHYARHHRHPDGHDPVGQAGYF